MSSYINFFIRPKDDLFIPIGDFSRSTEIYRRFTNEVPYEKITPISQRLLEDSIDKIQKEIEHLQQRIIKLHDKIKIIPTYNNRISEKEQLMYEYQTEIENIKDDIENNLFFQGILDCYLCMIQTIQYDDNFNVDKDKYIYAGIEVPASISEDLIVPV